ncbi:helix-turn-helix domain-containing protein [Amycolatopsis anabasis]|uniref:helix-turn-helix domain-containing protein n=1 Tax=Amycolatopsis anabasis TaxID=1840409 RepID=UPI00131DA5E3|nr:helix-turn-helix transcriptional regulator [Amycolatopsis anabasis]
MSRKPLHPFASQVRELGNELRQIRERSGLTLRELARILHVDKSKVSRWENGERAMSELEVAMYLGACRATEDERNRLLRQVRSLDDGAWVRPNGAEIPNELQSLMFHECTAAAITSYEPMVIPGLLQTEEYTRALFRWAGTMTDDEIEVRVRVRLARQRLLNQHSPPQCTFFIHEHAFRAMVGSARIMHEQLMYLVLMGAQPHCTIRVVPHSAGPCGAFGGAFRLMRYAEHRSVVYAENHMLGVFIEDSPNVASYERIEDRLGEIGVVGRQSREWVAKLATAYSRAEGGAR